jgi:pantetheine-phosphate adenylyltransferase
MNAMFPGSFDPPTLGHLDIIQRSAKLYDKLYVVVASNMQKKTMFSAIERANMLKELLESFDNIEVVIYSGLVVNFAKENSVEVMIRGVRALVDFGYEFELAMTNKKLYPELEVLFMPTSPNYFLLRSSQIKELAFYGANIETMVPPLVAKAIGKRLNE